MVAAFPVAKLGFLLVKQVAKPIAKSIAARARDSRLFREYVCIPVAQVFHWYEVKLKMRMMNVGGKVTKVPKLNEAKAIEQGSEILSEFIILSIASIILIYEYNRSKDKEEAKEAAIERDRQNIKNRIFELEFKVEKQTTQIRELARTVIHIEEDLHKRSLKRIFEAKPKVSQEILESAQDNPQPPLPTQLVAESSQNQEILQKIHESDEQNAGNSEEQNAGNPVQKKGLVLSAVDDILEKK